MFDPNYKPAIYSASKIWQALNWVELRDKYGYNIIARWIDIPCGTPDNPTGAKLLTPAEKVQLWVECQYDTCSADMSIVYAEKDNEMRGALVEMGMALGASFAGGIPKPIYVIGTCPSFEVAGHSDVAFMHHPLVKRIHTEKYADGTYDYKSGYRDAVKHYLENYHTPENVFRKTGFVHESITGGFGGLHQSPTPNKNQTVRSY